MNVWNCRSQISKFRFVENSNFQKRNFPQQISKNITQIPHPHQQKVNFKFFQKLQFHNFPRDAVFDGQDVILKKRDLTTNRLGSGIVFNFWKKKRAFWREIIKQISSATYQNANFDKNVFSNISGSRCVLTRTASERLRGTGTSARSSGIYNFWGDFEGEMVIFCQNNLKILEGQTQKVKLGGKSGILCFFEIWKLLLKVDFFKYFQLRENFDFVSHFPLH